MRTIVSVFVFLLCLVTPVFCQFDTAEVLGTVRDNSGGAVSKAVVKLTNDDTSIQAETKSDDDGNYIFSNVKIGKYTVTVETAGFSKAVAADVVINVNARRRVDVTLQLGAVSQSVDVTAAPQALETDSSEHGQVINTAQVVELPLNGRNYSDLTLLTTGVVRSPSAYSATPREGSFVVNGLRSVYNNFLLDGIDNNAYGTSNQGFANEVIQPSPDAVTEFKVITNNYSAEYGRSGGATIDVATRSGTNTIHGTAYDFLRNTDLNAIGYIFGQRPATFQKPTLQQNQFGVTIGGPIIKNRVFFFGDYEGFRSLQRVLNFDTIPSLNDRQGILPVPVVNPQTGQVFPANTPIPASATSPIARTILSQLPNPTGPGRANNYQQLLLNRNYNDKFDAKVDGQINSTMSAFVRISQRKVNIFNQPDIAGPSGGNSNGYTRVLNQQGVGSYTWTLTPSSLLEVRFAVSRTDAGKQPPAIGGASVQTLYGLPGLSTDPQLTGGLVPITLPGFNQLGRQSTNPQFQNPTDYDSKVNYSMNLGRQSIKVGFEFIAIRTQVLDVNPLYGRYSFSGGFSNATGVSDSASYAIADFLFGLPSQLALANESIGNYRQHDYFAYVQDDFRVSSKLTINAGLRWEFATPLWERDNNMTNFDPTTNSLIHAKSGSLYDRTLVNPDYNNFAPRFGFAYSATPKTVLRGGYGIGYIHYNRVGSANLLGINGPQVNIATINQNNPRSSSFITLDQGYPAGLTSPANFNPVNSNISYIPKNLPTAYVQSWFFDIQRQLAKDTVLDVSYVGNHSVALPIIGDYNQAFPQATPQGNASLQSRRPDQSFGAITWYDAAGFSSYNALQAKVEHRSSAGLYLLNSFTWSKAIDNGAQSLDTSPSDQTSPQDIRNLASQRGPSDYDQTFVNVTSAVYQIPFGRGLKYGSSLPGVLDQILGGWEVTAINNAQSALPINLRAWIGSIPAAFQTVGNLADYRGGEAFRPNVTGDPVNSAFSTDNYFNKNNVALSTDPSHPFGNAGRNSVRATPLNQLDLGVSKNFRLPREGMRLQFRGEFFNVLNHTNFLAANSDRNSAAFGTIRSTFPARQIQFALKLIF